MGRLYRRELEDSKVRDIFDNLQFVRNGKILLRGTKEWDDREHARKRVGCSCMSFGTIEDSRAADRKRAGKFSLSNQRLNS